MTDARGILAVTQVPDMLGRILHAVSSDAGESRRLFDVIGDPIFDWTARGHRLRRSFDALQRPTHLFAQLGGAGEMLVHRTVYGELHPDAESRNLRGVPHQTYDGAGAHVINRLDFHSRPVEFVQQLTASAQDVPDWTVLANLAVLADIELAAAGLLDPETFTTTATYDALDRLISRTTPDGSETQRTYNEANLLERVDIRIRGASTATAFIPDVDYNARGQREQITHGNGVKCEYHYDPTTFRLTRQTATRTTDGGLLQDLSYEYDPVGNVVQMTDAVSFGKPDVRADGLYEYDAIYQLVTAEGREHPGQQPAADEPPLLIYDHPNDLQAIRRYRETYGYDPAGNLTELSHQPLGAGPAGWTRDYHYATDSNRLLGTSLPGDLPGTFSAAYVHDAAGNMTSMPHLAALEWDHVNRLQFVDRGGGGQVYFAYDADGQRVRKVYDHSGIVEERVYLDGYELYRKRNAATGQIQLERQTLHVSDGADLALVETKTIDTSIPGFTATTRQRYQIADHTDSISIELDDAGAVITYEEYMPYGSTAWQATSSTTDASRKRYRYTRNERDEETGLDYHDTRYYAAWLGRWTSADPAGRVDGPNLYRYVRNRPVGSTDTGGQDPANDVKVEGRIVQQNEDTYFFKGNDFAGQKVTPGQAASRLQSILGRELNQFELGLVLARPVEGSLDITILSTLAANPASSNPLDAAVRVPIAYLVRNREYGTGAHYGDIIGSDTVFSLEGEILGEQTFYRKQEPALQSPLIDPIDLLGGALAGLVKSAIRVALARGVGIAAKAARSGLSKLSSLVRGGAREAIEAESEATLTVAYKAGIPGHTKIGITLDGKTEWAELIASEEIKEFSENAAVQSAQLTFGTRPAWIEIGRAASPKYQLAEIGISRQQAVSAWSEVQAIAKNPGTYNIATNSCATFCRAVMNAAGQRPGWWARTPGLVFKAARRLQ